MPDIFHIFPINAPAEKVFRVVSTEQGLNNWWTKTSKANPKIGEIYTLDFGAGYIWSAIVTKLDENKIFELQMTETDADWLRTKVGFSLTDKNNEATEVSFYHTGWPQNNEHYKISCFCWAMYLRLLKRFIEFGEQVPYEKRLSV